MFKKFIWLIVVLLICIYTPISFASSDGPRFMPGLFLLLDDSVSIPNTPTGLTISAHSSSALTLDWTDVSNNENGFSIFMSTTQFGTYSYIESDGIGLRFREAFNERYINGIRFVDYNNYKPKLK